MVARHPILRIAFDLTRFSEPLQLVYRTAFLPLEVEDLRRSCRRRSSGASTSSCSPRTAALVDLARPPLIRFQIHRRTDDRFQFTLTEPHAISDGWSTMSTLTEIFEDYSASLRGETPPERPPFSTTFRDFVFLERQILASPAARDFWNRKLDELEPERLPRWPGGPVADPPGADHKPTATFGRRLVTGLERLAREAEAPIKSVLLAAHCKAMAILAGRTDVVTGLTTHGRPEEADGEQVRGLFLNTLPFRLDLGWRHLGRTGPAHVRRRARPDAFPAVSARRDPGPARRPGAVRVGLQLSPFPCRAARHAPGLSGDLRAGQQRPLDHPFPARGDLLARSAPGGGDLADHREERRGDDARADPPAARLLPPRDRGDGGGSVRPPRGGELPQRRRARAGALRLERRLALPGGRGSFCTSASRRAPPSFRSRSRWSIRTLVSLMASSTISRTVWPNGCAPSASGRRCASESTSNARPYSGRDPGGAQGRRLLRADGSGGSQGAPRASSRRQRHEGTAHPAASGSGPAARPARGRASPSSGSMRAGSMA